MTLFQFTFHGAAMEVGRSCIELTATTKQGPVRIILDAGQKISDADTPNDEFPTKIDDAQNIDAVFISHAHLDHVGALPYLNHQGLKCPVFCNDLTKETTKLLIKDSYHISTEEERKIPYEEYDIAAVLKKMQIIDMYQNHDYKNIRYKYYDAGHIPGSASIVLDIDGKRVLYTGDVNGTETHLMHGTKGGFKNIDIMITETTYGDRDHVNRKKEEKRFLDAIEKTIRFGGSVLLPVFGVGRAQEVIMMLAQRDFGVPVYLDGMARKVTTLYLKHGDRIKSVDALQQAYEKVTPIGSWRDRKDATKQRCIIVTTAGMMGGGPVLEYIKHMHFDTKNAVYLTGYQAEGSNGRSLLNEKKVIVEDETLHVRCEVDTFEFSGHSGRKELKQMIKNINPKVLILQHGDVDAIAHMAQWCDFCEVHAPEVDEVIEVDV